MRKNTIAALLIILSIFAPGCSQQSPGLDMDAPGVINMDVMPVLTQDSGPAKGGRLNLFMTTPDSLNPIYSINPYIRYMSQFIFDSLFIPDGENNCKSRLAETWKWSEDGRILDIRIHDGVMFHDGTPLTSYDVAYTIETIRKTPRRGIYSGNVMNIDSTVTPDRLSIRIILREADPGLLTKLTFPILSEKVFKDWPIDGYNPERKPVGSGAFVFDNMNDDRISLSRNESWWYSSVGLGHPIWMDGIDFKIYDNDNEMMLAFQKQEIDVAVVGGDNTDSYSNRNDIAFELYAGNRFEFILLSKNGSDGSKLSDTSLRAALLRYIGWHMALNPIPIGRPAADEAPEYGAEGKRAGREDTLKTLTDMGMVYDEKKNILYYYKNGNKIPFTITLTHNALDPDRMTSGQWVKEALAEIGIEVTLRQTGMDEEKTLISSGKFDMMILGSRIPHYSSMSENLRVLAGSLNSKDAEAAILPLYRHQEAVLYSTKVRGPRKPFWKNIYDGWTEWYLVLPPS